MVPFVDLTRLTREIAPLVRADWDECLAAADFVGGPRVERLEGQLAERLSAAHVVACANGTDALILALLALGVRPGDRVAIPNLTFWATYEAVVAVGGVPIMVDVNHHDWQMDGEAARIEHRARPFRFAILVHLFGWSMPELDGFRSWCRDEGIALLEDGAQAFGVEVGGRSVFSGARIATLSFYPAKVIGGASDGGAIVCASWKEAERLRELRNHGRRGGTYEYAGPGLNSRMGAPNAAYLSHVLAMSDRILDARRRSLALYRERLHGRNGFCLHEAPQGVQGNGYLAVVTHAELSGDDLARRLERAAVGYARTYPRTILDSILGGVVGSRFGFAVSRSFVERVVNPPLFYGITMDEVEQACAALLAD